MSSQKKRSTVTITINVSPELKKQIQAKAKEHRRSLSNYITLLIEADLAQAQEVSTVK